MPDNNIIQFKRPVNHRAAAQPELPPDLFTFSEARFLKFYRWVGPIVEAHKGERRRHKRWNKRNFQAHTATDRTAYISIHLICRLENLYRQCKADEAKAYRLWCKRLPKEIEQLDIWWSRDRAAYAARMNPAPIYQPPKFENILDAIARVI